MATYSKDYHAGEKNAIKAIAKKRKWAIARLIKALSTAREVQTA